jgi:SH3-like domain-containing protein
MMACLLGCTMRSGKQGRQGKADSRLARWSLCLGALLFAASATAAAGEAGKGPVTGYDMPRFVSIRVDEANLRSGPDKYFPIRTVLLRRGMPVKVIDEFKLWRKIALYDGMEGWLHQSLISGRRTFLVLTEPADMREEPKGDAGIVARLEANALVNLSACKGDWCEVSVGSYEGWVPRSAGWGALPGEDFDG